MFTLSDLRVKGVTNDSHRSGLGMGFNCPHCVKLVQEGKLSYPTRLVVWFANPIDGGEPHPPDPVPEGPDEDPNVKAAKMRNNRWTRIGEDLKTITLTPSIDCPGHWHGHVTNGRIVGGI